MAGSADAMSRVLQGMSRTWWPASVSSALVPSSAAVGRPACATWPPRPRSGSPLASSSRARWPLGRWSWLAPPCTCSSFARGRLGEMDGTPVQRGESEGRGWAFGRDPRRA